MDDARGELRELHDRDLKRQSEGKAEVSTWGGEYMVHAGVVRQLVRARAAGAEGVHAVRARSSLTLFLSAGGGRMLTAVKP